MTMARRLAWLGVGVLSVAVLFGCSSPARRVRQKRQYLAGEAGLDSKKDTLIQQHCPFGAPKKLKNWIHGDTVWVYREGYVLEHSSLDKIPLWVCEGVTRAQLQGDEPRVNAFKADPVLEPNKRAELSDYRYSGYDRGHQAPAGNQTIDATLKLETFYLSNMAPQSGALNQRIWRHLESLVRRLVNKHGHAYAITGGLFYDPDEDDPQKADGWVDYRTIGKNDVAVPTHFYKIVVWKEHDGGQDKWFATAFVLKNRKYKKSYYDQLKANRCEVEWIEEQTGLDFMPEIPASLPPGEQARLEKQLGPMLPE